MASCDTFCAATGDHGYHRCEEHWGGGGTNFIISVWTAACNTQQPVDAGRHSKYCNSSVICRHNAIIWNVKWGYVDSRISNQAADGSLAGDGGFWNGSELTSDPVESFASLKPLASDSVERFSDLRGGGALHTGPDEAPAHLDVNFDSFCLFDSAPAYIDAEIADDGLVASSFARSAAGDTVMDTMSNDRCRSHSAMQSGVARILDLEKPRFIWEALGLETEGRLRRPLLCRFDSDGKPLEQNLTASENSELLRQCLDIKTERRSVCAQPFMRGYNSFMAGRSWHGTSRPTIGRAPLGCRGKEC